MIPKVSWGIDIGKSGLKAVKMQRHKETIEIQAVIHIPYQNMTEGVASPDEINRALGELARRHKIKAIDTVVASLPGQSCLIRPVKFPPVSDLDQMIQVEAGNHIPFDLDQVEWRHLKIERKYEPGEEVEVMLFAVKKEDITALKYDLRRAGIKCDGVTIAPLALFNLVKFEMDVPDNAIILDIGADHSDLVVMEGNRFFVRELPFSGNDLTREIAKRYKTAFDEAEKVKRSNLTGQQAQNLFSVVQPLLKDFVSEIHRSLMRTQSTFDRLLLLGDASRLAGLGRFLAQQLEFKIQRFRDIMKMELDREVDIDVLQQHLPAFAVSMGLALQGLGIGQNRLNFLPAEEQGASERIRKQYFIMVACAVFYVLLIFMWLRQGRVNATLKKVHDDYSNSLDTYAYDAKECEKKSSFQELEDDCAKLVRFARNRNVDIEILDTFLKNFQKNNEKLPPFLEKPYTRLRTRDKIDVYEEMEKKNSEKMWLLEYESNVVTEKEEGAPEEEPPGRFRKITMKVAKAMEGDAAATQKWIQKMLEAPLVEALNLLEVFGERKIKRLLTATEGGLQQSPWLNIEAFEGGNFRISQDIKDVEEDRHTYILFRLELKVPLD